MELSFALTRGLFEVFCGKRQSFDKVAFLGNSEGADPLSANSPLALFRAAFSAAFG